jgi:hypothetical protein
MEWFHIVNQIDKEVLTENYEEIKEQIIADAQWFGINDTEQLRYKMGDTTSILWYSLANLL